MKISIVIICKNEEALISKCLESVKGADECIILDTGSNDKTCELARKYTDKVFEGEYVWADDFSEARNYAIKKATGDWILSLDADETLVSTIDDVKLAIEENKDELVIGIKMTGGSDAFYYPRLFKNCEEVFWIGKGHECLNHIAKVNTEIVVEYGYSPAHVNDPERMFRIMKNANEENPDLVREKFYLAREYKYKKDYENAILWYWKYLHCAVWKPEIAEAYLMLAQCYWETSQGDLARRCCLFAIGVNPEFKEAFIFMGTLSFEDNKKSWLKYAELANNKDVLFIRK